MIYFDNAATSLRRPRQVADAVSQAIACAGNPGRSFHEPAMQAARTVFHARQAIAGFAGGVDPLQVAFTSGITESLNLIIRSLLAPQDHVITTVLEHNSVLRPLYLLGCSLSFLNCNAQGALDLDELPHLLQPNTRAVVCTHGSNLLGSVTDLKAIHAFCREHGLWLLVDAAQTMGCIPVDARLADALCFTGHKGLMGPQGTGGVITAPGLPLRLVKTGGSGDHSFEPHQALAMPDILEAGTPNVHGLSGLRAGIAFLQAVGLPAITLKEQSLTARFLHGLSDIPGITLYGPSTSAGRLPVVALNLAGLPAEELAVRLWDGWQIATRPGSHCAPLVHQRFGTQARGMVRFSFGWFNEPEEIDTALDALHEIAIQTGGV